MPANKDYYMNSKNVHFKNINVNQVSFSNDIGLKIEGFKYNFKNIHVNNYYG